MDKIAFRPLVSGDIDHVVENLCEGERVSLREIIGDHNIRAEVIDAVFRSDPVFAVVREGSDTPLALTGVVPVDLLEGIGALWFLATPAAFEDVGVLVSAGKRHVTYLHDRYSHLIGRIDARHIGTIKWLRRLGFSVAPPVVDKGVAFRKFYKKV